MGTGTEKSSELSVWIARNHSVRQREKVRIAVCEELVMNTFSVGDAVRRRRPWDGTENSGAPSGPVLTVLKIYSCDTFEICELSDGRSEFGFNLNKQSWYMTFAQKAAC